MTKVAFTHIVIVCYIFNRLYHVSYAMQKVIFMLVIQLSSGLVSDFHTPFSSHKFNEKYTGDFFKKGDKMNLEAVSMLILRRNTLAVKQKVKFPVAQLECTSGCVEFMPELVMCVNRGWIERLNWFDWGCAAVMPKGYSFKEYTVHCVGDYPEGSMYFVWIGSCFLKFSLKNTKQSPLRSTGTRVWCGIKNMSKVCKMHTGNKTRARKSSAHAFQMDEHEYVNDGVIFDHSVYTFVTDNVSPLKREEIEENDQIRRQRNEYLANLDSYSFGVQEHEAMIRPAVPERRLEVQYQQRPVQMLQKQELYDEPILEQDDSWIGGFVILVSILVFWKCR